jgi:uncharacterized membrane protein
MFTLLAVICAFAGTIPPHYHLVDLGTAPGGAYSGANAINEQGDVTGWSDLGPPKTNDPILRTAAVLWHKGKMEQLLVSGPDHLYPSGRLINEQGEVIIGAEARTDGYLGPLDTMVPLYSIRWSSGSTTTLPFTINAISGNVLGGQQGNTAVLMIGKKITALGMRPPMAASGVYGVTTKGTAVGFDGDRAVLWRNQVAEYLPMPPGCKSAMARAMNSHKDVLVWGFGKDQNGRGYLYRHGHYIEIPGLDPGNVTQPEALSANGQLVGEANGKAFLWDGQTTIDLNAAVVDGAGWNLFRATGINSRGEIVGLGELNGKTRAFLLMPVTVLNSQ